MWFNAWANEGGKARKVEKKIISFILFSSLIFSSLVSHTFPFLLLSFMKFLIKNIGLLSLCDLLPFPFGPLHPLRSFGPLSKLVYYLHMFDRLDRHLRTIKGAKEPLTSKGISLSPQSILKHLAWNFS